MLHSGWHDLQLGRRTEQHFQTGLHTSQQRMFFQSHPKFKQCLTAKGQWRLAYMYRAAVTYRVENCSGGDSLGGVVGAQARSQALLQALHVRVGAEEGLAGGPW